MPTDPVTNLVPVSYQGQNLRISTSIRHTSDHLILFLHGLGCAKESFHHAFSAAELQDFSICALDFVGFGDSARPTNFSYSMEDHAHTVRLILKKLSPAKLSIVAHSMGGAIGLLLAQQLNKLDSFINVEGNLVGADCGLVSRNTAGQTLKHFKESGYVDFLTTLRSSQRADSRAWSQWWHKADPHALHASARSLVACSENSNLIDIFNSLDRKAYVYGDEEPKNYVTSQMQDTTIHRINKAGHFAMVDNPHAFYSSVAQGITNNFDPHNL